MKIKVVRLGSTTTTYLLGIIAIHFLFEVAGGVAHDNDPILHDVRQVDVVVTGDHATTRATYFLSQKFCHFDSFLYTWVLLGDFLRFRWCCVFVVFITI